jgi:hypothetical protein
MFLVLTSLTVLAIHLNSNCTDSNFLTSLILNRNWYMLFSKLKEMPFHIKLSGQSTLKLICVRSNIFREMSFSLLFIVLTLIEFIMDLSLIKLDSFKD